MVFTRVLIMALTLAMSGCVPILIGIEGLLCPKQFADTEWSFVQSDFLVSVSDRGDVAWVRRESGANVLELTTLVDPTAGVDVARDVVGVAWANNGQRLAVVTRDSDSKAYALTILSLSLEPELVQPLTLPEPDEDSDYELFVVSWSGSDERVAVSTNAQPIGVECLGPGRNDAVDAKCLVVSSHTGDSETYNLANVYFVGDDEIVGTVPPADTRNTRAAIGRVFLMRLSDGQIAYSAPVLGARFVVASDPPARAFLVTEEEACPFLLCTSRGYLRSSNSLERSYVVSVGEFPTGVDMFPSELGPTTLFPP